MLQVALALQGFDQVVAIHERCTADWTSRAFLLFSCVVAVVTLGFVMERVNETLSPMRLPSVLKVRGLVQAAFQVIEKTP